VLLNGQRAPLRGRICMNLCMVDVTHIPEVDAGHDAVLLGAQGDDAITAEQLADWLGTIAYEVLTLPRSHWRREEA
jgi:alanine racemase